MDNIIDNWENKHENAAAWRDLIKDTTSLDEKYIESVAEYLNKLAEIELPHNNVEGFVSFIPINLQIISKIKDFSKIILVDDPSIEIKRISLQISQDQIHELTGFLGPLQITQIFESTIINVAAKEINENIDNGKKVKVYRFAESISIISDGVSAPALTLKSRLNFENN